MRKSLGTDIPRDGKSEKVANDPMQIWEHVDRCQSSFLLLGVNIHWLFYARFINIVLFDCTDCTKEYICCSGNAIKMGARAF